MRFSHPWALILLAALLPNLFWGLWTEFRLLDIRRTLVGRVTRRDLWRGVGRCCVALLTGGALILSLAGWHIQVWHRGDTRHNAVLAVGLDVSKSMLAEDVGRLSPANNGSEIANRLNLGRQVAAELFQNLAGETAGLFFFARNGIEVVPPTRDQGFLRYMVQQTELANLTESGSDLAVAMDTGAEMAATPGGETAGIVILISDGEDTENEPSALLARAELLAQTTIPVFTVGIGRDTEVFIPIRRPGQTGIDGFFEDHRGDYLKTGRNQQILRQIADITGGLYFAAENHTPQSLSRLILEQVNQRVATTSMPGKERMLLDLAPWLLLVGLLGYMVYLLL
jgi:Ca-activated chloride channel homolog